MLHKLVLVIRRRTLLAGIATLGALLAAVGGSLAAVSAAALPPGCSQSGQIVSCTQTFTSGSNPFAVPAGVSSIHVVAVGGMGCCFSQGATVTGDLPVHGGGGLYAVVAGNAGFSTPGANGGGGSSSGSGGGGGASDVRSSQNDLSSRLLVAGGGGGTGGPVVLEGVGTLFFGGPGGAGGGHDGTGGSPGGGGGGGGSSSAGGGGGEGSTCFSGDGVIVVSCSDGGNGAAGVLGVGGAGGFGGEAVVCITPVSFCVRPPATFFGGGGGGGGGGLFGGGGAGGGGAGGGGGGGSNLVPPGGSQSVDTTGAPMVQISYKLVPTSKDQCTNGGWRNYPQFKNQGDCVSFVENGK